MPLMESIVRNEVIYGSIQNAHFQGSDYCQFKISLFDLLCLALIITLKSHMAVNHSLLGNYICPRFLYIIFTLEIMTYFTDG